MPSASAPQTPSGAVASDSEFYLGSSGKPTSSQHTVFFTDRALYRPGQTIQYKGIYYHKARRYLLRGEYYGAQDEFARYAKARPHDGEAQASLARTSLPCGDREGAHVAYRNACERLLESGQRGRAEAVYMEAARAFDHFTLGAEAHLDLAFGLERNLKPVAALKAYESFVRVHDDHTEAAFALLRAANIHSRAGRLDRARLCYEHLVARYPQSEWSEFATDHARRLAVS